MASIGNVPLELLRAIAGQLALQDLCNWVQCHPFFYSALLGSESFCAELVEKLIPCSAEAVLAKEGEITYRKALVNTFQRREAFARCKPLEVLVVSCGTDFLYQGGTLCSLDSNLLSIVNGYAVKSRFTINLDIICRAQGVNYKLTHCASNLLTVRVKSSNDCKLAIFDITDMHRAASGPILMIDMPESQLYFVRNNDKHLVVGTYRSTRERENTWHFTVFSLGQSTYTRLDSIGSFCSTEIGSSIAFEIIDDYFWVLTSQITSDPEGADPTSYYGGCFVDLAGKSFEPCYWRMWRRQQTEGPIDDAWTKLSLAKDDLGSYVVCETRTEFLQTGEKLRSFYTTIFARPCLSGEDSGGAELTVNQDEQAVATKGLGDQPSSKLDVTEKIAIAAGTDSYDYVEYILALAPEHALTIILGLRIRQCEYDITGEMPNLPLFRIKHHFFHFYSSNARAFIDLVNDPQPESSPIPLSLQNWKSAAKYTTMREVDTFRLRVGTGHLASVPVGNHDMHSQAIYPGTNTQQPEKCPRSWLDSASQGIQSSVNCSTGSQKFSHQPVLLYPDRTAKRELLDLFKRAEGAFSTPTCAFADERAFVFGSKVRTGQQADKIVLVSFDPMSDWSGVEITGKHDSKSVTLEGDLRPNSSISSTASCETSAGLQHAVYWGKIANERFHNTLKRSREVIAPCASSISVIHNSDSNLRKSTSGNSAVKFSSTEGVLQDGSSGKRRRVIGGDDDDNEKTGNADDNSGDYESRRESRKDNDDETDAILRELFGEGDDPDSSDDDISSLSLKHS